MGKCIVEWNDDNKLDFEHDDLSYTMDIADGFRKGFSNPNFVKTMKIRRDNKVVARFEDGGWTIVVSMPYNLPDEVDFDALAKEEIFNEVERDNRAWDLADWNEGQPGKS